jgi:Tfp pilus assembly protein PilO
VTLDSPRATLVAGVLGLLVAAAASWLLLVGPATDALAETRTEHADTVDANRLLAVRLHAAEKQRDELPTTVAAADELTSLVPATADQPAFFALVDAAAEAAGIDPDDVTALSPPAPVTAAELTEDDGQAAAAPVELALQTVTVSVEASYDQVQRLLDELEALDRALLVQDVALSTLDDTTTAQLVGTTFVAPPLEAPDVDR